MSRTFSRGAGTAGLALGLVAIAVAMVSAAPGSLLRHAWSIPVVVAAWAFGAVAGGLTASAAVLLRAPFLFPHVERVGVTPAVAEELTTFATLLVVGPLVGALAADARGQRHRQRLLTAVQDVLAEERALGDVVERLAEDLRQGLKVARAALVVRDAERLARGGPPNTPAMQVAERVIATGTAVFVPDAGGSRPRRVAGAPLVVRGEVVGALAVERVGELGRSERAALTTLAASLGLALENARLAWRQRHFADELSERVAAATRRLVELDRAKSTFVAVASHELRTPLSVLFGFAELLVARTLPMDEVRRVARILRQETERLGRIVDDLLDLARLEQGLTPVLRRRRVVLAPALADAVELFRAAGTHDILVACDGDLVVDVDADALDRVVKNLVSNAIKYSPRGTTVTLGARQREGAVEIVVADEGPGMPNETAQRVFEPYYRAPDAVGTTRGAGLGLAVVRTLVEAHGGAVQVESALGVGTRFAVTLPSVP